MNFGTAGKDFASEVWNAGFVGIWYGSWVPQDLYDAYDALRATPPVKARALATELTAIMMRKGSSTEISPEGASAALRFDEMAVGTWVFTYFDRTIHLAQISALDPEVLPQFAYNGDTFKAKSIQNKKCFRIDRLPPSFLLLPTAGRGNVHKLPSCSILLQLLIENESAAQVSAALDSLPWDEWISALGPKAWEALCLGYLIQEHGFLPTGLDVGGTLADFDIVGRLRSGELVYAQCKGNPHVYTVKSEDEDAFGAVRDARMFFFARHGVSRELQGVTHLDQSGLVAWLTQSDPGKEYLHLLRPQAVDHFGSTALGCA